MRTLVAFALAPVLPLLLIVMIGMDFSSPAALHSPLRLVRPMLLFLASPFFAIGMLYMYAAQFFLAMPLHAAMRAHRITSVWSYGSAGTLTALVVVLVLAAFRQGSPDASRWLWFTAVSVLAGFLGGSIFWAIAVRQRRPVADGRV